MSINDDDRYSRRDERETMIHVQIQRRCIKDERVMRAMLATPREWFMPDALAGRAYNDAALPIECDQTISQPYMVARMTELLELTEESRVLEIGAGSGYQTAILSLLSARVYTVERHSELLDLALQRFVRMELANITARLGDGSVGWAEHAPYEAIIVTAGAPRVPESLKQQLTLGGRLVIPVGDVNSQILKRVIRTDAGFEQEDHLPCRFVNLVGEEGWEK